MSGVRPSRPQFDRAFNALIDGGTHVITTRDQLRRSTQNMLAFANELRSRGAGLRGLNLNLGEVDTATPIGSMLFTIMAALAQTEHEIKRERVTDSNAKRREVGKDLGGRPRRVSKRCSPGRGGEPATQGALTSEYPEQRFIGGASTIEPAGRHLATQKTAI